MTGGEKGSRLSIAVKSAREWAFLGMYEDAERAYSEVSEMIRDKLSGDLKPNLREAYESFQLEVKKESSLNADLLKIIRTGMTLGPRTEPKNPDRPAKRSMPFQEPPFSFHGRRQFEMESSGPESGSRSRVESFPNARSMEEYPPNAWPDVVYQGPGRPAPPPKDPMVWDPPPTRPIRNQAPQKKLAKSTTQTRTSQAPRPQDKNQPRQERNYEKPWQLPKPPAPEASNEPPKSRYLLKCYPDGNGPDADLINMIESSVISQNPNISFEDIAGLEEAKDSLRMNVICPLTMTEYFKKIRTPPKGMLLFGPPGTGKTMLAKAIATTGKTTFCYVHPTVLASKWKGDSEKLVRILFEMARFYAPTTIFIDEIDSVLSSRSSNEHESSRKVKVQFFIEIDGVCSANVNQDGEIPKVFILGATNRPWDLDEAILRRLTKRIYIPLPDRNARLQLFHLKMRGINVSNDIDYDFLVSKTENYNSDDIESVCKDAAMAPFQRKYANLKGKETEEELRQIEKELLDEPITMNDFRQALAKISPSSSTQFLSQYAEWTKAHGSS